MEILKNMDEFHKHNIEKKTSDTDPPFRNLPRWSLCLSAVFHGVLPLHAADNCSESHYHYPKGHSCLRSSPSEQEWAWVLPPELTDPKHIQQKPRDLRVGMRDRRHLNYYCYMQNFIGYTLTIITKFITLTIINTNCHGHFRVLVWSLEFTILKYYLSKNLLKWYIRWKF